MRAKQSDRYGTVLVRLSSINHLHPTSRHNTSVSCLANTTCQPFCSISLPNSETVYRAVIIENYCMPIVPGGALQQYLIDSAWKLLYVVLNVLDDIQLINQHNSPKTLTTHCFVQSSTPSLMFYTASCLSELTTHTILDS